MPSVESLQLGSIKSLAAQFIVVTAELFNSVVVYVTVTDSWNGVDQRRGFNPICERGSSDKIARITTLSS